MDTTWTNQNFLKLLKAIKTNICDNDRMKPFSHGVKMLDWEKVAFPPFSPIDCHKKWINTSEKMRTIRTLEELVDEAADELLNTTELVESVAPKRPAPPMIFFYKENRHKYHKQHPEFTREMLFKHIIDEYNALTKKEKAPYVEKFLCAHKEYKRKLRSEVEQERRQCLTKEAKDQSEMSPDESTGEPLPPKPPRSGYLLFCKEQLKFMVNVSSQTSMCLVAQRWRELTNDEKSSFNARCETMKRDYFQKLNDYDLKRQDPLRMHNDRTKEDTRPSDSEDEDIEVSSSEEEGYHGDSYEEIDDEDVGDICFNVF